MPKRKSSKGGPFTAKERATLRELHAQGKCRNDIATLMKRSPRTISVHAERMDLHFDRTATAAATEARMQDFKGRRAAIAEKLYDLAETELAYLGGGEQYELVEVSAGKAVKYAPKRLPAQDRRALTQSIGSAMTTATRLEALDTNNGVDEGISLLGQLATGLTAAYNAMTEEAGSEGAGDAP